MSTSVPLRHKNAALESAVAEMFSKLPWVTRVEQNFDLRDGFVVDIVVETEKNQWFVDVKEHIPTIHDAKAIISNLRRSAYIERMPKCSFIIVAASDISREIKENIKDAEIIDANILRELALRHPDAVKPVEPFLAAAKKTATIVSTNYTEVATTSAAGIHSARSEVTPEILRGVDNSLPPDSDTRLEIVGTVATMHGQPSVNVNSTVIQRPIGPIVISRQMLILQIETLLFALVGNVEAAENRRNEAPTFDLGLHEGDDFLAEIKRLTRELDDLKSTLATKSDVAAADTGRLKRCTDAFLEGLAKKCGEHTGDAVFLGTALGVGWIVIHVEQNLGLPITEATKALFSKLIGKGGK